MFTREPVYEEPPRDLTRDPREDEDWFQRMPPAAQEEMRERFRLDRMRFAPRFAKVGRRRNRCLREGVAAVVGPLVLLFSWAALLVAVPLALLTGWIWHRANMGRLWSGGVAMAAVVTASVAGGAWSARTDVMGFFHTSCAAFLAGLLGAAFGLRRELDEFEGE